MFRATFWLLRGFHLEEVIELARAELDESKLRPEREGAVGRDERITLGPERRGRKDGIERTQLLVIARTGANPR
ncbi:MAG: hypothetical protein M3546_04955 [Actinomycetota bacterium]|nr:hypothetical protein [Actinomycetota bacterium]